MDGTREAAAAKKSASNTHQIRAAGMFVLYVRSFSFYLAKYIIIISARTQHRKERDEEDERAGGVYSRHDGSRRKVVILRGVQGRQDRACDQLLALAQDAALAENGGSSLPRPLRAQSSGACNAKRDRTHPPSVRPPNNTLASSAAASSSSFSSSPFSPFTSSPFTSTSVYHRATPPSPPSLLPLLPARVSLNLIFLPALCSLPPTLDPTSPRDLYSPRNDFRRHFNGESRYPRITGIC